MRDDDDDAGNDDDDNDDDDDDDDDDYDDDDDDDDDDEYYSFIFLLFLINTFTMCNMFLVTVAPLALLVLALLKILCDVWGKKTITVFEHVLFGVFTEMKPFVLCIVSCMFCVGTLEMFVMCWT